MPKREADIDAALAAVNGALMRLIVGWEVDPGDIVIKVETLAPPGNIHGSGDNRAKMLTKATVALGEYLPGGAKRMGR